MNLTDAGVYNSTDVGGLFESLNVASGGTLIGLVLFMQWMIIFMIFKNWDTPTVFLINSFLSTLLTFIFAVGLAWISWNYFIVSLTMFGIAVIIVGVKKA